MRRPAAILLVLCVIAAAAAGPRSRAEDKPDLSTPKGAVAAFFKAMEKGDVPEAKNMATGSQKQLAILETLVPLMSGFKQLEVAATKKWGDEGRKVLTDEQGGGASFNMEEKLKNAKVEEKGDVAVITPAPEDGKVKDKTPMKLKKMDGKWKIDLASLPSEGMDDPNSTRILKAMGEIARTTAGEIDAGKYATAEDAKKAMSDRVLPLLLGGLAQPPGAGNEPPKDQPKKDEPKK
jgi:hypothetical protein